MNCENLNNTGAVGCRDLIGTFSGVLLSSVPFRILKNSLATKATIQALLIANDDRLYLIKDTNDYESVQQRELQTNTSASGKTNYYGQTPHSFNLKVRRPNYYEVQKKLFDGATASELYGVLITKNGYFVGNEDGTYIKSRKFQVAKNLMEAEDYTTDQMIVFSFTEDAPNENIKAHFTYQPSDYDPNSLESITDVEISIISQIATSITASVNIKGKPAAIVSSLLAANFEKLDSTGDVEAISGVTYTSGIYTIAGTAFTDGTLAVKPVVSDLIYYETPTPATIDIV